MSAAAGIGAEAWGAAGAPVLALAISASAFKILEVSGAAAEPFAGAVCPPRGLKPGAGDPSGVVDSTVSKLVRFASNDAELTK